MAREYDFKGKLFHVDPAWQRTLKRLEGAERLKIWDTIMDYRLTGEEISLTGQISDKAEGVYWSLLDALARFDEFSKESFQVRSEAGKRGMNSRWHNKHNNDNNDNNDINDTNVINDNNDNNDNKHNIYNIPYHTNPNHTNPNPSPNSNSKEKIYKKESAASEPLPHPKKEKRFIAPSLEEVREYMQSYVSSKAKQGIHYDFKDEWAEDYCDFYGSKGWMVGSNKMKDWRLAASKWVRSQSAAITTNITHNNYPKIDNNHFEGEYNPHIYDNEEENWL